jgi:hypothetical protein
MISDNLVISQHRYGSGPRRVKVTVQDNNNESYSHFVIELAMLVEMPYAFLKVPLCGIDK